MADSRETAADESHGARQIATKEHPQDEPAPGVPAKRLEQPSANVPAKSVEDARRVAESLTDGLMLNALAAVLWSTQKDANDVVSAVRAAAKALQQAGARVNAGDLSAAESLLTAQSVTLNTMFAKFAEMARHAEDLDHLERFTRLALRAQSQCARTLEVLGGLKNPTVITKQANVAMTQQVVNGPIQVARVNLPDSGQNKLLGEAHGEPARMEPGTAREGSRSHSRLEAVAVEHRPTHPGGQDPSVPEREQGCGGAPRALPGVAQGGTLLPP